nr:CD63 antigen-like [Leptinotarsa decemlineata]
MIREKELNMNMRCIKYMIFVANFMFVLVGFLLISIGTTIKAIYSDFDEFLIDHYYNASKLAIAVGIIIFIVSLFGCVGALKESVCLMNMFALSLSLVLILEFATSIAALTMRGDIREEIRKEMNSSMDYYESYADFVWDATQYNLRCCGIDGPNDWKRYEGKYNLKPVVNSIINSSTEYAVPDSCCRSERCSNETSLYKRGCLNQITLIVTECALLLKIGTMCIAFIQLLGVIFAHLLARSIRRIKSQIQVDRMVRKQQIYEQFTQGSLNSENKSPVLYTPSSSEA